MPTLALINFNIVCATLGGFISVFGLVSYLFKERFYLSEALISLLAGIIFSPHAANFIRPKEYALGSEQNLEEITMYFTRLVLGVQLVLAGVQLPKRYLQLEWKSLSLLLGPGMAAMWLCSSLVIWAMIPNFQFLHALIIGACVTPTDPVLSNSIVKGKFADKNVPRPLQRIIVAESGANDGLGYPFLFFAMYLLKYTGMGGAGYSGGAGKAMGLWFYETWAYTVILSVVYGITVGWVSRELLHWAEEKRYVDRESFLVFAIALAYIGQIEHLLQAAFVGFFGPIGVGAIFYLSVCREFLQGIIVDGKVRDDAQKVSEAVDVVVWFLVICSIVVHGLSIPLVKAGYHLPRTISHALSVGSTPEAEPVPIANVQHTHSTATQDNSQGRKRPGAPRSTTLQIGRPVNLVMQEPGNEATSGGNTLGGTE
ncbi:unnamed protein product [Aspergillus oryzae RIB40]|uniref:DNA, SC012 n=1 Tax=Aspergillus oryzae (strain ATCC 42149 / RIB 40) TaxID=510516 RepID=Q2UBJ8_ASPOR|nr:unnamed protein product [Aspergillus oryzae RIB40]BAE61067.1 unnamed protein product [Aspergillus oryzae RIB40]